MHPDRIDKGESQSHLVSPVGQDEVIVQMGPDHRREPPRRPRHPSHKVREATIAPRGVAQSHNKSTSVQDKALIWKKRDVFFIQHGALTSVIRNKCLDSGAARWQNGRLKMFSCQNKVGPNQRFTLDGKLLTQRARGHRQKLCVVASNTVENGTRLAAAETCRPKDPEQWWAFERVPSLRKQYGYVQSGGSHGGCLTKPPVGRQTDAHAPVVVQPCSGWCNQTWSFGDPVSLQRRNQWKPRSNGGRGAGRILCWILTFPAASDTKASAVNRTWGRKCDHLLFMTTEHVADLDTVKLELWGPEGRSMLWTKSKMSWLYIYEHFRDKAEWFVKADDDTYLAMDNLHRFLGKHDTEVPAHFGRLFVAGNNRYYSGGSGIVLSRGALRVLGGNLSTSDDGQWAGSFHGTGPEDLLTSKTLKTFGISADECVDDDGRQLFMPMGIDHEYFAPIRDEKNWFYRYSKTAIAGPGCCSENWAAIHYVKTNEMYGIDQVEDMQCGMSTSEWPHLVL